MPATVVATRAKRRADFGDDAHIHFARPARRIAGIRFANFGFERGIGGFPQFVASANAFPANSRACETHENFVVPARFFHAVNVAALFFFLGRSRVEHDAVAGFQRSREPHEHAVAPETGNRSEKHAALFSETCVHELAIVHAAQPTRVQSARERHFERVAVLFPQLFRESVERFRGNAVRRHRMNPIDAIAIRARNRGNVFGRFQTSLNFERTHAEPHQRGQHFYAAQIAR